MLPDIIARAAELALQEVPEISVGAQLLPAEFKSLAKLWAAARFTAMQESIAYRSPDDPHWATGYLTFYDLRDEEGWPRFVRTQQPALLPRELILLASVSEEHVPFQNPLGEPHTLGEFQIWKQRLLGRAHGRRGILDVLRPGVESVRLIRASGWPYLARMDMTALVKPGPRTAKNVAGVA